MLTWDLITAYCCFPVMGFAWLAWFSFDRSRARVGRQVASEQAVR